MKFIDPHKDQWHALGGEDGPATFIDPSPYLLLSIKQWHAFRAHWPAGMPVGVMLANDAEVKDIAADLPRLGLVQLHFPKWMDGRAYSQAHTLRARYRFAGEVRAKGEVLVDMVLLLKRNGFDAATRRTARSRSSRPTTRAMCRTRCPCLPSHPVRPTRWRMRRSPSS
jgi:uncharacterized protein (DUF934 family)